EPKPPDTKGPIPPTEPQVEFLRFGQPKYDVRQGKKCRINLLVNSDKFPKGARVSFISPNPDFKLDKTQKIMPEPLPEHKVVVVPVVISCDIFGTEGSVIAECVDNERNRQSDWAELTCTEESPVEPDIYDELEFKPSKIFAEADKA